MAYTGEIEGLGTQSSHLGRFLGCPKFPLSLSVFRFDNTMETYPPLSLSLDEIRTRPRFAYPAHWFCSLSLFLFYLARVGTRSYEQRTKPWVPTLAVLKKHPP